MKGEAQLLLRELALRLDKLWSEPLPFHSLQQTLTTLTCVHCTVCTHSTCVCLFCCSQYLLYYYIIIYYLLFIIVMFMSFASQLLSVSKLSVSLLTVFFSQINFSINPLMATLKPHNNGPLYSNAVIGTLAVDFWVVTFSTARRGLGCGPAQSPPRWTKCNSPPISGQCTYFVLFDMAL